MISVKLNVSSQIEKIDESLEKVQGQGLENADAIKVSCTPTIFDHNFLIHGICEDDKGLPKVCAW